MKLAGRQRNNQERHGAGFDYVKELSRDISDNVLRHGRGISLVVNTCDYLEYVGNGSEVIAFLETSDSPQ